MQENGFVLKKKGMEVDDECVFEVKIFGLGVKMNGLEMKMNRFEVKEIGVWGKGERGLR